MVNRFQQPNPFKKHLDIFSFRKTGAGQSQICLAFMLLDLRE